MFKMDEDGDMEWRRKVPSAFVQGSVTGLITRWSVNME